MLVVTACTIVESRGMLPQDISAIPAYFVTGYFRKTYDYVERFCHSLCPGACTPFSISLRTAERDRPNASAALIPAGPGNCLLNSKFAYSRFHIYNVDYNVDNIYD